MLGLVVGGFLRLPGFCSLSLSTCTFKLMTSILHMTMGLSGLPRNNNWHELWTFSLASLDDKTHTHTRTYARTHSRTHARTHAHTHTHTHTHTYTHTHTHCIMLRRRIQVLMCSECQTKGYYYYHRHHYHYYYYCCCCCCCGVGVCCY